MSIMKMSYELIGSLNVGSLGIGNMVSLILTSKLKLILAIASVAVYCISIGPTQGQTDTWDTLLDRIALGEGTSDAAAQEYGFNSGYDVLYGYHKPEDFDSKFSGKSLTEMTLGEIWELQEKMGIKDAVGKYQILSETLFGTKKNGYYGLQDILGLSDDTIFDAATQERLAQALLERRGYSDWMDGRISDDQFQLNLAKEWASVADPTTDKSYYGQNVGATDAQIKEAMQQTKAKQATQGSQQIAQEAIETSQKAAVPSSDDYKSTIPIPTGSAAEALKEQGKYEEYMQNALQAAEKRIEQDPKDGEAWYAKGLALYYLNRGPEADKALAKAGDLGIQFEFDGGSFFRASPDSSQSIQQSSPEAQGESIPEEESVPPKFYPTTSTLSDEDVLSSISQGLEPITQSITASQSQSISKDFLKGDKVETTDLLNVRSVPGLPIDGTEDTRISEPMGKGITGTILEGPVEADGFTWWKIQYDDGTIGWSQDKRLELQPTSSQRTTPSAGKEDSQSRSGSEDGSGFGSTGLISPNSATVQQQTLGERAVELARSVEGAGYESKKGEYSNYELMDSEAVKKEGIDCSGLVFWAFNTAADVSTWRPSLDPSNDVCPECVVDRYGADGQWNDKKMWEVQKEFTTPPSEDELKPGDLLYVNTDDKGTAVDHVGIYAGNGKVIHSTTGGVTEINYDEWKQKYASSFFGYGRVEAADNIVSMSAFGEAVPQANAAETDDTSFGAADTSFGTPSSSSQGQTQKFGSVSESEFGGINFTSIKLNSISVSTDRDGGVNFDFILKAQKAEGASPGIDPKYATRIGAIAFMTGLAVPDDKFWVNLMPWEPDRIIDKELAQSDVGRIMLEADFQMKKDFSNYGDPCSNEIGKTLRSLMENKRQDLVQNCMDQFPGEIENIDNVWFHPVIRHWIVPDKIYAYTNGTQIYIINATLTINSVPVTDHSSFRLDNQNIRTLSEGCLEELNKSATEYSKYWTEQNDRLILPLVVEEVNQGVKYGDLRNVYLSLALAQWYKSSITLQKDIFREGSDLLNSSISKSIEPWSPQEIWTEFNYSFNNGEYICWENTTIPTATGTHTRTHFKSEGGVEFGNIRAEMVEINKMPLEIQDRINRAIEKFVVNEGTDVIFGRRLHVYLKKGNPVSHLISKVDTNLSNVWNNKGVALQEQGKLDAAIEAFDEAIERDPHLANAWYNKGAALQNQGKLDEAIEAYDEAVNLNPNFAEAQCKQ